MRKRISLLVFAIVLLVANVCFAEVKVSMLNVGQGDSFLIQGDNKNIMIDTGPAEERVKLVRELAKLNVTRIDTLILTHAHADHIGNAGYLIKNYGVGLVCDNGQVSASRYYRAYMKQLNGAAIEYRAVRAGDVLKLDEELKFEVQNPLADEVYDKVNNESVVGRLVYGNFRMLFTGDIEQEAETALLYSEANISASVLKAAHHGSKTSSLLNFVEAVNPKYVLISAGAGNRYGHPHADSLYSYLAAGLLPVNLLCTVWNGTVTITTDGSGYSVEMDRRVDWVQEYLIGKYGYVSRSRRIG